MQKVLEETDLDYISRKAEENSRQYGFEAKFCHSSPDSFSEINLESDHKIVYCSFTITPING